MGAGQGEEAVTPGSQRAVGLGGQWTDGSEGQTGRKSGMWTVFSMLLVFGITAKGCDQYKS